jgi:hypothetical protein
MKRNAKIVTLVAITIMTLSSVCAVYAASTMYQASWYYGNGSPTEHKSDGSFYIDLCTNNVYQSRKLDCGDYEWVLIAFGTGKDGVDGKDGEDGANGATWRFGATNPESTLGANGDLYLNFATWDVFAKVDCTWTLLGNIKGQDGKDGLNGLNGKDGINGTNGVDGRDGVDGIDGRDGLDGRDGINGLNGMNGTNGVDGKDGVNGTDGIDGRDGLDFNSTGTVCLYNGTNGIDGVNGTNGRDGKDGIDGINGLNGQDGKDGADGLDGVDGKSWTDAVGSAPSQNLSVSSFEIPWWFFATLAAGFIASLVVILYALVTGYKKPV